MKWVNDPEVRLYLNRLYPEYEGNERDFVGSLAQNRHSNIELGIEVLHEGKPLLIGTMGMHGINWRDRTASTGTMLGDQRFQNRGIGTAAKMVLLRYAFLELNLRQVYSSVISFNGRSARYAQKCGYRRIGRVPRDHYADGHYYDKLVFMVTRVRWLRLWQAWRAAHDIETIAEVVARHHRQARAR
jgi:RimJ/RimL family protein N-acetyltransferase